MKTPNFLFLMFPAATTYKIPTDTVSCDRIRGITLGLRWLQTGSYLACHVQWLWILIVLRMLDLSTCQAHKECVHDICIDYWHEIRFISFYKEIVTINIHKWYGPIKALFYYSNWCTNTSLLCKRAVHGRGGQVPSSTVYRTLTQQAGMCASVRTIKKVLWSYWCTVQTWR